MIGTVTAVKGKPVNSFFLTVFGFRTCGPVFIFMVWKLVNHSFIAEEIPVIKNQVSHFIGE